MTPQTYFEEHTLDETFLKEKFAVSWDDQKITIPIYDIKGNLLYCRYRHLEGTTKFTNDKGAHPALFAIHKVKKLDTVVLCEGEPDTMRLWQAGIPAVTGTSGVKTFSEKLAAPLAEKEVLIVLDNDDAGFSAVEKYYEVLKKVKAKPRIVSLPTDYKDVCEYFTAGFTKEDFEKLPQQSLDDWLDTHEPKEHHFIEGDKIMQQKLPPEEWLVDRVLPAEGFAFIVGAEATGKSFYTLTLAHAVSTGSNWLNAKSTNKDTGEETLLFTVPKPEKVLIIDKENTRRRTQSRMKGLGMTGKNIFWMEYPHYFELADPNEEDGLSKVAKAAARKVKKEGIKFIIVDSFADVMVGNENAAGDVQGFFDAMRKLFPGCSILVLHHASKPAPGVVRTSAQRARGSTNIMAQVYSAFYVEAMPKSKKEFILEQTKAGDAEKLEKFMVELKTEPIPDMPGKTKVVAIQYNGVVPDEEMKIADAVSEIEDFLTLKVQAPRQELADTLQAKGISQATMKRALKQMTEEGIVDSIPDPNNKSKRLIVLLENKMGGVVYEE